MAIYDFKCSSCGDVFEDVILSCMHEDEDHPTCERCDLITDHFITKAPMGFVTDSEFPVPFKAGALGEVISNKKQRKEFMVKNDLLDANEVMTPPSKEEDARTKEKIFESVRAISPTAKQKDEMKSIGLGDIV